MSLRCALTLCFAFFSAALTVPTVASAADIGMLPLAAPQVDANTRTMVQESLLTAVQAVFGSSIVEPGELKKRLGPMMRQALECSDGECWIKVGGRAGVTYVVSARGFGKKGNVLLTLALVRGSDGKIIGRAQQPLAIDDPVALSASSEALVRKLSESAVAAAPELASATRTEVVTASAAAGSDTVVNDQPGDAGSPGAPLAGMPATTRSSTKAPEWKAGFGFVEDAALVSDAGTLRIDKTVTIGTLPSLTAKALRMLFFVSMPSYADGVGAANATRFRFGAEWTLAVGDNALNSAPLVGVIKLPFPRILMIGEDSTTGARGWMQMVAPLGLAIDYRLVRLAHAFNVGVGPHGQLTGGFLTLDADSTNASANPSVSGFSAEATYGGHLSSSIKLASWGIQLVGGAERFANLTKKIGSASTETRIYGAATFMTLRLTASYNDFVFGVDYRGRVSDTPQQPTDTGSAPTYANRNVLFAKELSILFGGTF